jgi:branched-chain amino acid transport system ATP-binding protein
MSADPAMSANPATEPVLSIEHLGIRFGGLQAVADLTFSVREGEVVSLIGPNGAGKTTAFNAVTGYIRPSEGRIVYRGKTLNGLKPYQIANLGLVRTFQKTSLFDRNTVLDNILIGLHREGSSKPWEILLSSPRVKQEEAALAEKAHAILDFVGLSRRAYEHGGDLPYGEQRLLEVAIALAARPTFLLLDEPVSGMNPTETGEFMKMLSKIRAQGITILLVEHDMRMVMGVSDRVVVLNQGRLIAEDAPEAIQRHPEVIRAYLGEGAKRA